MITVSLCMIVKNEERTLRRCLDSVRGLMDEIIIADTGSTDRTVEIARDCGAAVCTFPWRDDFAAARNFAFSKATMQYCMWLDADDVLELADREAFRKLKETLDPDTDVVMLRYHTGFDESGKPTFSYWRERLLRRAAGFRWQGAVHEAIVPAGRIVYGDAAVSHRKLGPGDPDRNLRIFEGLLAAGKTLAPREQFYYARELTYHGRDREAAAVFQDFLDGGQGWVENNLEACRNLYRTRLRLNEPEKAFAALTRALRFGPPRAELCCDLGGFFFERNDFKTAAFWYTRALEAVPAETDGGFREPDCWGYLPLIQLCVCWYRLGTEAGKQSLRAQPGVFRRASCIDEKVCIPKGCRPCFFTCFYCSPSHRESRMRSSAGTSRAIYCAPAASSSPGSA